jgi:hypothetical protein
VSVFEPTTKPSHNIDPLNSATLLLLLPRLIFASTMTPLTLTVRAVYGRHLPPYQEPSIPVAKTPAKQIFERRRLQTKNAAKDAPTGPGGPDYAHFIAGQGLVGHDM